MDSNFIFIIWFLLISVYFFYTCFRVVKWLKKHLVSKNSGSEKVTVTPVGVNRKRLFGFGPFSYLVVLPTLLLIFFIEEYIKLELKNLFVILWTVFVVGYVQFKIDRITESINKRFFSDDTDSELQNTVLSTPNSRVLEQLFPGKKSSFLFSPFFLIIVVLPTLFLLLFPEPNDLTIVSSPSESDESVSNVVKKTQTPSTSSTATIRPPPEKVASVSNVVKKTQTPSTSSTATIRPPPEKVASVSNVGGNSMSSPIPVSFSQGDTLLKCTEVIRGAVAIPERRSDGTLIPPEKEPPPKISLIKISNGKFTHYHGSEYDQLKSNSPIKVHNVGTPKLIENDRSYYWERPGYDVANFRTGKTYKRVYLSILNRTSLRLNHGTATYILNYPCKTVTTKEFIQSLRTIDSQTRQRVQTRIQKQPKLRI